MNRFLKSTLLLLTAMTLSTAVLSQPSLYVEGTHYTVLSDNALSRQQGQNQTPLVTEIFWYGCPHCYEFEPLLNPWVAEHGDSISFSRSPAVWDGNTKAHAILFYATRELGINEQLHEPIFREIHQQRNFLLDAKSQLAFLQASGSSQADAEKTLKSFNVDSQVRKADALQRELKVPSIPTMIVKGRYMVNIDGAIRSHADMLKVVDYLLTK